MNNLEGENKKQEKKFDNSQLTLLNRKILSLTGVEKIYESSNNKIQLKVAGSNLLLTGDNLTISKLDVESGVLEIDGLLSEAKYTESFEKGNFFKRLFK